MGLDEVPFTLSALEDHPDSGNIDCFITRCWNLQSGDKSELQVVKMIRQLKENPPAVNYENPNLLYKDCCKHDDDLIKQIFFYGLELPGSKLNLYGMGYFSDFFIDMYFGNYTEFIAHVKSLSSQDLKRELERREGHCQYSPLFASILGIRMVDLFASAFLTDCEKQEVRIMYSGNNENKHLKIIRKLLKLGTDPNAHDIYGFTPLHHALTNCHTLFRYNNWMVYILLKNGANPNAESINGWRPLKLLIAARLSFQFDMIDMLIEYNARLVDKKEIDYLKNSVETHGSKELAAKVREAMPREKNECEKCSKAAPRFCSACGLVSYCSPACQKLDWKIHKITCRKKERKPETR